MTAAIGGSACGTETAHRRHRDRKEPIDPRCEAAHEAYLVTQRGRKAAEAVARRRATAALVRTHQNEFRALVVAALEQVQAERSAR